MQIQVIANCQARPLSMLIPRMADGVRMLEPVIVHLAKTEDEAAHLTKMEQADVIFAQLTQDQFQPAHLSTKNLKARFGEKVVVWPNIFYLGQQPYLRYFTHPRHGRLMGPLEALHDIRLYRSWKETGQIDPTVLEWSDPDFMNAARASSLHELQGKEALCDVKISDFIIAHENSMRLFFTFNHPSLFVLCEMARRLLAAVNQIGTGVVEELLSEPLDRFQVPSVWSAPDAVYQGDVFTLDVDNNIIRPGGAPHRYTGAALCAAYQQIYDANKIYHTFDDVRLTPNVPSDLSYLSV